MNAHKKILSICGLIGIGVMGRLLPHVPNATPMTAITLAAGKHLGRAWAFLIPMAAMLIADAYIGFYDWRILAGVYISFALIGATSWTIKKTSNTLLIVAAAVTASIIFFLITNFTVWLFSPWYEKSISGLAYCYTLGLPFLRNMLIGDVFFTLMVLRLFRAPAPAEPARQGRRMAVGAKIGWMAGETSI